MCIRCLRPAVVETHGCLGGGRSATHATSTCCTAGVDVCWCWGLWTRLVTVGFLQIAVIVRASATAAYSAEEALRLAAAAPLDAVVSDLRMPTDGCDLARALAAAPRRPLLMAVTGVHGAEERCRAAGFDHVLLKPADPDVLVATATRHERRRAAGTPWPAYAERRGLDHPQRSIHCPERLTFAQVRRRLLATTAALFFDSQRTPPQAPPATPRSPAARSRGDPGRPRHVVRAAYCRA